mmetsp:Transcript_15976/g.39145  ORF Transcript_15976/g.39145 Transcript_15976/m.39145 type:complete len:266 (+) Transcript_15976:237-1034(+)
MDNDNITTPMEDSKRGASASIQEAGLWTRPEKMFAHIHMAKTAGTSINGHLAGAYERICGDKGYSHDYFQYNEREKEKGPEVKPSSRGKVKNNIMDQIGYEDCDWISIESPWGVWRKLRDFPLEFHVPCREPISHLLSECNHQGLEFNCDSQDLVAQIRACNLWKQQRFSNKLSEFSEGPLKCFTPIPIDRYLTYMGNILQPRRLPVEVDAERVTSAERNETQECLWKPEYAEVKANVTRLLFETYDYYRFCESCIGTSNDLFEQ